MSEEALRRLRELRREHAALVRALDKMVTDPVEQVFACFAVELKRGVEEEIDRVMAEIWRGDGI